MCRPRAKACVMNLNSLLVFTSVVARATPAGLPWPRAEAAVQPSNSLVFVLLRSA
jgi:hypothetical protein